MAKMTREQRRVIFDADSKASPCRGAITGHPGTVNVLDWRVTRAGLVAAGVDMDALHAEAAAEDRDRDDDDFRPAGRPSLAALHRKWLDRGLPSSTWVTWLRQYNEMYGDAPRPVEHTHDQALPCIPSCRRWGQ